MSVWKFPCYKDDVIEQLFKKFDKTFVLNSPLIQCSNIVIDDFGAFPCARNLKPGNLYPQIISGQVNVEDLYKTTRDPYFETTGFAKMISNIVTVRFGLKEIYNMAKQFLFRDIKPKTIVPEDQQLAMHLYTIGAVASYQGPARSARNATNQINKMTVHMEQLDNLKKFVSHIKSIVNQRRHNRKMDVAINLEEDVDPYAFPAHIKNLFQGYELYCLRGLLLYSNDFWVTCGIMTMKDIDRFYQIARGVFLYDMGKEQYADTPVYPVMEHVRNVFVKSLSSDKRANELCRAWDVAYNMVLAQTASDVSDLAVKHQMNKIGEERLNEILDIYSLVDVVMKLKPRERIDVMNIYKCLPTPDYDYFGQMERQRKLYSVNNPVDFDNPDVLRSFKNYYIYMMLRAFKKKHGKLPGYVKNDIAEQEWHNYYPNIRLKDMNYNFVEDLELEGSFVYKHYKTDIMSLVKDSAIPPKEQVRSGYELGRLDAENKNMLLDIFSRDYDINLDNITYNETALDVKAEDKAEAKKPNGRMFFEAPTDVRLKHSEYEAALSKYLKHLPGAAVGLRKREMIQKMNLVTKPEYPNPAMTTVFVSFDLTKFSPHYNNRVHMILDEINAYLFGEPHLKDAHMIHDVGYITYYKKSIRHSMKKFNADLEGMSGKMNTIYHTIVMGLTVNNLRAKHLIIGGASLATFIDDGLLRINVANENFKETLQKIIENIDEIYKKYGFEIAFDKTFISTELSIFLHRIFFRGRELTSALKSVLKMDNYSDRPAASILDDIAMAESSARAALACGSRHEFIYAVYCYLIVDTLRKWKADKNKFTFELSVWCFAPISLGGLGCRTIMALCGSLAYSIQVDWLSMIFQIKRRKPEVAVIFNNIMNQPVRKVELIDTFFSADTIRTTEQHLNAYRFVRLVERIVSEKVSNKNRLNFFSSKIDITMKSLANLKGKEITAMMMKRICNASVELRFQYIAKKFLRSRTAIKIIGIKRYVSIHYANIADVGKWFQKF